MMKNWKRMLAAMMAVVTLMTLSSATLTAASAEKIGDATYSKEKHTDYEYGSTDGEVKVLNTEAEADAKCTIDGDGVQVGVETGASVTAVHTEGGVTVGNDEWNVGVSGTADVGKASGKAEAGLNVDKDGNVSVGASVGAELNAVEVGGEVSTTVGGVGVSAGGSVKVGVGGKVDVGYEDGKVKVDVGASLGIGVEVQVEVDVGSVVDTLSKVGEQQQSTPFGFGKNRDNDPFGPGSYMSGFGMSDNEDDDSNSGNGLMNMFKTIGGGVVNTGKTVGNGIATAAKTVGNGIATAAKTVGSGIASAAKSVGNAVCDFFGSIF